MTVCWMCNSQESFTFSFSDDLDRHMDDFQATLLYIDDVIQVSPPFYLATFLSAHPPPSH